MRVKLRKYIGFGMKFITEEFERARQALREADCDKDAKMWVTGDGRLIVSDNKGFRVLNNPCVDNTEHTTVDRP